MKVVNVDPKFAATTDEQINEALNDPDPENEIAVELSRLIAAYGENITEYVNKLGHIPDDILRFKGSCPMEEQAIQLVAEQLRQVKEEFNQAD